MNDSNLQISLLFIRGHPVFFDDEKIRSNESLDQQVESSLNQWPNIRRPLELLAAGAEEDPARK